MGLLDLIRPGRPAHLLALALAVVGAPAGRANQHQVLARRAHRRTGRALPGPPGQGLFQDRAGSIVTIDEAANPLEPISRVASGGYDMGFADINALIRYRDQNPTAPIKAVFMVYNKPPYAIVTRKSRGITEPKQLEGKKLGAPPTSTTILQWPLFAKLNNIDVSKVTIENVAIPVRAPMLAAGQLDAALGFSFRVFVDLKDRGVPVDDIVLLADAELRAQALRQRDHRERQVRRREAGGRQGVPARLPEGPEGDDPAPGRCRGYRSSSATT